jgi:hypothetical protein
MMPPCGLPGEGCLHLSAGGSTFSRLAYWAVRASAAEMMVSRWRWCRSYSST